MKTFFGKYRGKVENNIDPLQLGRIQVSVPAVLGDGTLSWAMPCVPYAGPGVGFFAIPPKGASVWVEFEGGDPDYPIWAGCFWAVGDVPAVPAVAQIKLFKTENVTLELNDLPGAGGFKVDVASPAVTTPVKMVFDSQGVELETQPASIVMNASKVEVTHTGPSVKIEPSAITLKTDPATAKVEASGISAKVGPSALEIKDSSVEVKSSATGKFSSSGVELKNGSQSLRVEASNVSINDGNIEVM